jgi:hypothetical protein
VKWSRAIELVDVDFNRLNAEVDSSLRRATPAGLTFDTEGPFYRLAEDDRGIDVRYGTAVQIRDEERNEIANLAAMVLMRFEVEDEVDFEEPETAEVEQFVTGIAARVAFPYLREALQSLAYRCGLPKIVIGISRDPSKNPELIWVGPTAYTKSLETDDEDD